MPVEDLSYNLTSQLRLCLSAPIQRQKRHFPGASDHSSSEEAQYIIILMILEGEQIFWVGFCGFYSAAFLTLSL